MDINCRINEYALSYYQRLKYDESGYEEFKLYLCRLGAIRVCLEEDYEKFISNYHRNLEKLKGFNYQRPLKWWCIGKERNDFIFDDFEVLLNIVKSKVEMYHLEECFYFDKVIGGRRSMLIKVFECKPWWIYENEDLTVKKKKDGV